MKICFASDLHGHLPQIPQCDVLCLAGDYYPGRSLSIQMKWHNQHFLPWLERVEVPILMVPGNHDHLLFNYKKKINEVGFKENVKVLIDERIIIDGLEFYGTPWTKTFYDWWFMMEEETLERWFTNLKTGDILVSHSPPYRILDAAPRPTHPEGFENVGSKALLNSVLQCEPKIHVFGHIHECAGCRKIGKTMFINVSQNVCVVDV